MDSSRSSRESEGEGGWYKELHEQKGVGDGAKRPHAMMFTWNGAAVSEQLKARNLL